MAKCPVCRGRGYRLRIDDMRFAMAEIVKCESCDGKGVVEPLTEQEYLQTCNTEQLADKLTDFSFWLVVTIPTEDGRETVRKRIVEWLKQPHEQKGD